jgi:hypothetical protein
MSQISPQATGKDSAVAARGVSPITVMALAPLVVVALGVLKYFGIMPF